MAERETPESLAVVRRLLEGSVDAAVILDRERQVLYRNPAYDSIAARTSRENSVKIAEGHPCYKLFPLEICEQDCLLKRADRAGRALRLHEVQARRADGEEVTLIVTATPLPGGYFVETYRDVTAESRVQRKYHQLLLRERTIKEDLERVVTERTSELARTQEELIRTEKLSSLGRLVAGIAHELNNPINFIYGNVEFIDQYFRQVLQLLELYEKTPPDEPEIAAFKAKVDFAYLQADWERLLRSVRAGAERTAQIVAGLRVFSRPQQGRLEETDLLSGLEASLQLIRPLLRDHVVVHCALDDLPPIHCRAVQIQQVLVNLLTNAVQAMGEQGGEIFLDGALDGEGVRLRVRDTGPGIAPAIAGKIFDPFFTTKEVGQGTGLGLAICQRIVQAHGGRLALVPSETGATFELWLPIDPPLETTT